MKEGVFAGARVNGCVRIQRKTKEKSARKLQSGSGRQLTWERRGTGDLGTSASMAKRTDQL